MSFIRCYNFYLCWSIMNNRYNLTARKTCVLQIFEWLLPLYGPSHLSDPSPLCGPSHLSVPSPLCGPSHLSDPSPLCGPSPNLTPNFSYNLRALLMFRFFLHPRIPDFQIVVSQSDHNTPYIHGEIIYSAFRWCINLNFVKLTFMTGFVLQGHICQGNLDLSVHGPLRISLFARCQV